MTTENDTMRALVQRSRGGPSGLTLQDDYPRPTAPGPGDYLVRVEAAGVNFADVMQSRGTYGGGPEVPYVAGFEAAGEIIAAGVDVEDPHPVGTHVIGAGRGAFAEHMTMPAAAGVLPVPSGWSDAEALGLVLNWATALAALRPLGEIAHGDVVLIHAAAGGVGQAAVRIARHYGAQVIATASPAKHGIVRSLGVDTVLDADRPDLAAEIIRRSGGVDLVLESVGKKTFATSLSVTKPFTGRIVVLGAASGEASLTTHDLVFSHPVQIKGLHLGALADAARPVFRGLLDEIQELIDQGVYAPCTPHVHPLHEGPTVLRAVASGTTHGKHALDPWWC
ncbi:zinc-binding dehydrogenase [Isoptericola halotolerans]|uniref:NADPH:quinone reductase-like Zn-dependent oxidoreductase n=1 Tax=Isoptericola halotolerans TaxID=300560 RepID=A0ABX2AA67_9MICO|nr:zinc-binding dehydrogenase [Isoptericola halotolerans]NOV98957.1 NADPH:quinone reductase-like Zn-dependent oxidoreductase [Isoptericola halotolerans]